MKRPILTLLFIFCSVVAYCQHGYRKKLKNVATIMFPDTPQVSDNSTRRDTVYVNASPEGIIYVSEAVYAKRNLKEILMSHFQDSIYATVLRTTLNAPKYKLLYKKNIASNNLYGLEFGYKALVKGRIYYGYNQVFYFNNVLINNSLWSPDSLTGERKPLKDFLARLN